jgi:hypothetical protein
VERTVEAEVVVKIVVIGVAQVGGRMRGLGSGRGRLRWEE